MKKSTFTLECLCSGTKEPARVCSLNNSVAFINSQDIILICQKDSIGLGDDLTFTLRGVQYIDEGVIVSEQIIKQIIKHGLPSRGTS